MGMPNLAAMAAWGIAQPTPTTSELATWGSIFGLTVAIWVLFLPERWLPDGALTLVGNSHNIMHIVSPS